MTNSSTSVPGAPVPGTTGHLHPRVATRRPSREDAPGVTRISRSRERTEHMSKAASPRRRAGGQHDSSGGTRVPNSLPTHKPPAVIR